MFTNICTSTFNDHSVEYKEYVFSLSVYTSPACQGMCYMPCMHRWKIEWICETHFNVKKDHMVGVNLSLSKGEHNYSLHLVTQ